MTGAPKDPVASIHQRLLNGARDRGEDFQLTLLRYGAERLLYWLCQSPHAERFVLKGALLLLLWPDQLYRPTRDVDLESYGDATPEHLREVFRSVCRQPCPEDALRFDEDSVAGEEIRAAQESGGVRVTLPAWLGRARIRLQVDVGFGDAITPSPRLQDFPTLLSLPAPRILTYPIETVIAEKFEAIVRLGRANSRMKDFRDLITFARRSEFDGELLCRAVSATFARRAADLEDLDEVLESEFDEGSTLGQRWRAYCRTSATGEATETHAEIGGELIRFLEPLGDALRGSAAPGHWSHQTGWTSDTPGPKDRTGGGLD